MTLRKYINDLRMNGKDTRQSLYDKIIMDRAYKLATTGKFLYTRIDEHTELWIYNEEVYLKKENAYRGTELWKLKDYLTPDIRAAINENYTELTKGA